MDTKEVLLETKKFLRTHKWGKGSYHDYLSDKYCLVGAVIAVTSIDIEELSRRTALDLLNICVRERSDPKGYQYNGVIAFNDAPHTLKRDVIDLIDCAIEKVGV